MGRELSDTRSAPACGVCRPRSHHLRHRSRWCGCHAGFRHTAHRGIDERGLLHQWRPDRQPVDGGRSRSARALPCLRRPRRWEPGDAVGAGVWPGLVAGRPCQPRGGGRGSVDRRCVSWRQGMRADRRADPQRVPGHGRADGDCRRPRLVRSLGQPGVGSRLRGAPHARQLARPRCRPGSRAVEQPETARRSVASPRDQHLAEEGHVGAAGQPTVASHVGACRHHSRGL